MIILIKNAKNKKSGIGLGNSKRIFEHGFLFIQKWREWLRSRQRLPLVFWILAANDVITLLTSFMFPRVPFVYLFFLAGVPCVLRPIFPVIIMPRGKKKVSANGTRQKGKLNS
jgi:hypothetical protein